MLINNKTDDSKNKTSTSAHTYTYTKPEVTSQCINTHHTITYTLVIEYIVTQYIIPHLPFLFSSKIDLGDEHLFPFVIVSEWLGCLVTVDRLHSSGSCSHPSLYSHW